jgi:hypothetical protein
MPGHPVRCVHISNIKIRYEGKAGRNHAGVSLDQLDSIPNREKAYPEFTIRGEYPDWAFFIRHDMYVNTPEDQRGDFGVIVIDRTDWRFILDFEYA